MSIERKAVLITIVIMISIFAMGVFGVAASAASPKIARIYHRDGTIEILNEVTYVRVYDERLKSTSVIEICSGGKVYRFFNAEVEIESDERKTAV